MSLSETKYGFDWGPMSIERLFDTGRGHTLQIKTKKTTLQVYVTPTGKVRIFNHFGGEWQKPTK